MINRRQKKKSNPRIYDASYSKSRKSTQYAFGVVGKDKSQKSGGSFSDIDDMRSSIADPDNVWKTDNDRRLASQLDSQLNTIEEEASARDEARDSNMDILDRGSRYVRRNKRLKKFQE